MNKLLSHLMRLTSQRDRHTLDATLTDAVRDGVSAIECDLFAIATTDGFTWLNHQAWACDRHFQPRSASVTLLAAKQDTADFPVLARCLKEQGDRAEEILPQERVLTWFLVWDENRQDALYCVRVRSTSSLSVAQGNDVQGLLTIYRNYVQLIDDNEHDSLTGLLNRKTFDRRFSELVASTDTEAIKALEAGRPERRTTQCGKENWLAVIDIDNFKSVNDQFGHVYGDEVLILLANILKTSFRAHDRVFRFGGEEFVVLLRSSHMEDARKAFERLRLKIEQRDFPQIKHVTISLGFVSISSDSPVTILGHADQALYFAKANGRNQVCSYDELVESGKIGNAVTRNDVELF